MRSPVVTYSLTRWPIMRPRSPATSAPISGRKTIAWITASALHHVDVVDRDGAAVAVEHHENGEAYRGLRRRDRKDQQREDLAGEVAQLGGEGDKVDVHREQDQLHRHQDD